MTDISILLNYKLGLDIVKEPFVEVVKLVLALKDKYWDKLCFTIVHMRVWAVFFDNPLNENGYKLKL